MLVTFKTNAYSDITMFGSAAVALLKMMGQSGNVPGALMSADVPQALQSLNDELRQLADVPTPSAEVAESSSSFDDDQDEQVAVGLDKRAGPLVSLLEAAIEANENVLWNE